MDSSLSIPFELVDTVDGLQRMLRQVLDARQAFKDMLLNPQTPLLYIDIEGTNLCRNGTVSLIQLHIPTIPQTFVIDVYTLGSAVFEISVPATEPELSLAPSSTNSPIPSLGATEEITLKSILESPNILKSFFDCR
jgi:hypothetical protein